MRPRRGGAPARLLLILGAALAAGAASPARAQQPVYAANEVKAAFLYHFGTYVEWPPGGDDDPITIAVLGADSVADALADFLPGRAIHGRPALVRRLRNIGELSDEEILFIGAEENARLERITDAVSGQPVLVVTDAPDGLNRGAIVNFQVVDRRVRFEISVPAAETAGLSLSSRLLSAAMRVETTGWWFQWPDARSTVEYAMHGVPTRGAGALRQRGPS